LKYSAESYSGPRKTRCACKRPILHEISAESPGGPVKTRSGRWQGLWRAMQVELRQLDRRYEGLRTRSAGRERTLLASLAEVGQQAPLIVVRDAATLVVVDGYKRVRALERLGRDVAEALEWTLPEPEALLLDRALRTGETSSALEQGWLVRELSQRFDLSLEELARRFDRTRSWVSRRLALVGQLPASVQEHVRVGSIGAHAATKYLVPLARANQADCVRLADAVAPLRLSNRCTRPTWRAPWPRASCCCAPHGSCSMRVPKSRRGARRRSTSCSTTCTSSRRWRGGRTRGWRAARSTAPATTRAKTFAWGAPKPTTRSSA